MTSTYLPFTGSITDGCNTVLCSEIASDVADAIAALPTEIPFGRARRLAINTIAERRSLPVDVVASAYAVYDYETNQASTYAGNRAANGDRLAMLLVWAFRRLPRRLRADTTQLRLAAAIDKLACAAVPCDMGDLSRLRNGKREPLSSRPATAVTALLLSTCLLEKVRRQAGDLALLDNEKHREVVTPARLEAASTRLLRLAHRLTQRDARRAAERKVGEQSPTNPD